MPLHDLPHFRRENIDPANNDHVVISPQSSTVKHPEGSATRTRPFCQPDQIPGPKTNRRGTRPTQVGDNHLPCFSLGHRLSGYWVDHLYKELALVHMDRLFLMLAVNAIGPDFGQTGIIVRRGSPRFLHFFPDGGNQSPWLTGVYGYSAGGPC